MVKRQFGWAFGLILVSVVGGSVGCDLGAYNDRANKRAKQPNVVEPVVSDDADTDDAAKTDEK